jgi:hypothetical protein
MVDLPQEVEDSAKDEGYEGVATIFESLIFGSGGKLGIIPDGGRSGRLIKDPNPSEEARIKVCVANGMMALIAQVYLENGQSAAQLMVDFATMINHVETGWYGPEGGKKPTHLRVIRGEKKT